MKQPEYFMDGDTLMVSIVADSTNVVTRPANEAEQAMYAAQNEPEAEPKPKKKAAEE